MLALYQPIAVSCQEDASALALLLWLHNEGLGFFLVELLLEVFTILRQYPRFGKKVIVIRKHILQILQILGQ